MGMDIDGGMIVGALGEDLFDKKPEGVPLYEWVDDLGLDRLSKYYDADDEECYYGFCVDNVLVTEMTEEWIRGIRMKAIRFADLTGVPAMLIGSQDIT